MQYWYISGGSIIHSLEHGPFISEAGGWFNIKMSSYQYRKPHYGDKTILRPSYLHNGISYTGKMSSLYWIMAQVALNNTLRLERKGRHFAGNIFKSIWVFWFALSNHCQTISISWRNCLGLNRRQGIIWINVDLFHCLTRLHWGNIPILALDHYNNLNTLIKNLHFMHSYLRILSLVSDTKALTSSLVFFWLQDRVHSFASILFGKKLQTCIKPLIWCAYLPMYVGHWAYVSTSKWPHCRSLGPGAPYTQGSSSRSTQQIAAETKHWLTGEGKNIDIKYQYWNISDVVCHCKACLLSNL